MKSDEYVPANMPMSIVRAKSKMDPSPKQKRASTAKSVVSDVMTVRESKGLEFTAVGVIERGMTLHEKYIAFTRALYKLAVWEEV